MTGDFVPGDPRGLETLRIPVPGDFCSGIPGENWTNFSKYFAFLVKNLCNLVSKYVMKATIFININLFRILDHFINILKGRKNWAIF